MYLKKREAFDHKFSISMQRGYVVLAYPDSRICKKIPDTKEDFVLRGYKDWLGKPYSRLTLYLSPIEKKETGETGETGESTEIVDWSEFDFDIDILPQEIYDLASSAGEVSSISTPNGHTPNSDFVGDITSIPDEVVDHSFLTTDFLPFGFTEEKAIKQAIQLSLNEHGGEEEALLAQSEEEDMSNDQFTELLKAHAISQISGPHRKMVVSRASIWETALPYFKRKTFADSKGLVEVTFATFEEEEDAIDLGGPRRESLHLLLGAICSDSKTVTATPKGHVIRFNVKALRENDYYSVGLMLSIIILQGGEPPNLFSPSICDYMTSGLGKCNPTIEEIPNASVRTSLEK